MASRPEDASGSFGTNNYASKSEAAQKEFEESITLDDFTDLGTAAAKFITKDLPKGTVWAFKAVKSAVTPGFIKRNNAKKVHIHKVEEEERAFDKLHDDASSTIAAELRFKHQEHMRSKLVRDLVESRQHIRDKVREAIATSSAVAIDEEFRAFHRRRAEQLADQKARLDQQRAEEQRQQDAAAQSLREWRMDYYSTQASSLTAELAGRQGSQAATGLGVEAQRQVADIARVQADWAHRETGRQALQVLGPATSDRVRFPSPSSTELGVFAQDARQAAARHGGEGGGEGEGEDAVLAFEEEEDGEGDGEGVLEEVDGHDVHLFSPRGVFRQYEADVVQPRDLSASSLRQQEELYAACQEEDGRLAASQASLQDMSSRILARQAQQTDNELAALQARLAGPPPRLPYPYEVEALDLLKRRQRQLADQRRDVDCVLRQQRDKRDALAGQMRGLAQTVATLRDHLRRGGGLGESNEGMGHLPIVLGTALHRAADPLSSPAHNNNSSVGEGPLSTSSAVRAMVYQPRQAYEAVVQASRLEGSRASLAAALSVHKERGALDRQLWAARLEQGGLRHDVDAVLSRLAALSQRLQASGVRVAREHLLDALQLFLLRGTGLTPVHAKAAGRLPWFAARDVLLSSPAVVPYLSPNATGALVFEREEALGEEEEGEGPGRDRGGGGGVTLGEATSGHVTGLLSLPRDGLWSISLTLTAQTPPAPRSNNLTTTTSSAAAITTTTQGEDPDRIRDTDRIRDHEEDEAEARSASSSSPASPEDPVPESVRPGSGTGPPPPPPPQAADGTDYVTVRLGPDRSSLSLLGTYFARANPATGFVLYDVKYLLRGKALAYRFDWSSSSPRRELHLAVCTGLYEEFALQDLEQVTGPASGPWRKARTSPSPSPSPSPSSSPKQTTRVLSSFVKKLRVEEQTGSLRQTRLLEELIALEASLAEDERRARGFSSRRYLSKRLLGPSLFWDSRILSQSPQRFAKRYFLRILKAELLLGQTRQTLAANRHASLLAQQIAHQLHRAAAGGGSDNSSNSASSPKLRREGVPDPGSTATAASAYLLAHTGSGTGGGSTGPGSGAGPGSGMCEEGEERRQRVEASQKRYLAKKRSLAQTRIAAARDLEGQQLVVWDDAAHRWRNVSVLACRVGWADGGTAAEITHLVQEHDDVLEPVGPPRHVNLALVKFFAAPTQHLDHALVARYKRNKHFDALLEDLSRAHQQQTTSMKNAFMEKQKQLLREYKRLVKQAWKQFPESSRRAATRQAGTAAGKREIKARVPAIVLDMKRGLVAVDTSASPSSSLTPTPFSADIYHNNALLRKQALRVAKEEYINAFIEQQRRLLEDELRSAQGEVLAQVERDEQDWRRRQAQADAAYAVQVSSLKAEKQADYRVYRSTLQRQLTFPPEVFSRAVPRVYHCEHTRTKCWGSIYHKGVRCLACGAELSSLHLHESQVLGYGTAFDAQRNDVLTRHTRHERTFRFASGEELAWVEEERVRLEKERRALYVTHEPYFYDLQTIQAVYDFDRRHAKQLKGDGVFRQGVQWQEDEVQAYLTLQRGNERDRLERDGLPASLLEDFDPLETLEHPPPTFRLLELTHKAHYHELIFNMGRLHNYQRKIREYKLVYFDLLDQQRLFAQVLDALHRSSFAFAMELQNAEVDLDRTSQCLSILSRMQQLWSMANAIRQTARREKKRAEMNLSGLAPQLADRRQALVYLHDEMKQLLMLKKQAEGRAADMDALVGYKKATYQAAWQAYETARDKVLALQVCMPGNLVLTRRYGQVYITSYRVEDDVVLCLLPFGSPRAKAYLHYREIVDMEAAVNQRERHLMEKEDAACQRLYRLERVAGQHERQAMAREEAHQRQVYAFLDLHGRGEEETRQAIDVAVQQAYAISQSRRYEQAQRRRVEKTLDFRIAERKRRRRDYIGPPSGQPKNLTTLEIFAQRRAISLELKQRFLSQAAGTAEAAHRQHVDQAKQQWMQTYSFHKFIDGIVSEMMVEVCTEALQEGIQAKLFTEKKIGIFMNLGPALQYDTYRRLVDLWQQRKEEVRRKIEMVRGDALRLIHFLQGEAEAARAAGKGGGGAAASVWGGIVADLTSSAGAGAAGPTPSAPPQNREEEVRQLRTAREVKKQRKAELARQAQLCSEMHREEVACREFYRWELKENLRERRLMREEETMGMRIRREEEKARAEALAAAKLMRAQPGHAAGGGGQAGGSDDVALNAALVAEIAAKRDIALTYEQRRAELKELTLERRRRAVDQEAMALADQESHLLREIVRMELQRAKYIKEFGTLDDGAAGGEAGRGLGEDDDGLPIDLAQCDASTNEAAVLAELEDAVSRKSLKIPSWLKLPRAYYNWTMVAQNAFLKQAILVDLKHKKIAAKVEKEEKLLVKLENRSYRTWEKYIRIYEYVEAEAELRMLESLEEVFLAQHKLSEWQENLSKLSLFCRLKGEEELKAKTEIRKLDTLYADRLRECQEAEAWLNLCQRRAKNRDKLKRKVMAACQYTDTESINGFHQRFRTERLRDRIYQTYFRSIVLSIVNQAEIIASERQLLRIQFSLTQTKNHLHNRVGNMKSLLRSMKADDYLRRKRSYLNQTFFPHHRREVLSTTFANWIRFYYWNKGHQDAFTVKMEVLRRQLDLQRQYPSILAPPVVPSVMQREEDKDKVQVKGKQQEKEKKEDKYAQRSLMQAVRERVLLCSTCKTCYLAAQNHSLACVYHPDKYEMACPATCRENGLALQCMAHRKKRWLCCKNTSEAAAGCARRYHVPPPQDDRYDAVMQAMHAMDNDIMQDLDVRLEEARKQDFPGQVHDLKRKRLHETEDEIVTARETAARYKTLKFV